MFKKFSFSDSLELYRSGSPFKTEAVILNVDDESNFGGNFNTPPNFSTSSDNPEHTSLSLTLKKTDRILGLGQSLGGINKRGRRYAIDSTDTPIHTPDKISLYGCHSFFIIDGKDKFGVFIDYPSEIRIDAGFSQIDQLKIELFSRDFDFYLIKGKDQAEIVKNFLTLVGQPYTPPRWAFGYQQCRWSYPDQKTVQSIADNLQKHDIPCDAIYIDIDYMDNYKIFTVDKTKFPDLPGLAKELKDIGIKLISIIDPGVKIEDGYEVYESGKELDVFCKDKDGKNYPVAVWPGLTNLPDFFDPKCQEWWGDLYKPLKDMGLSGFWNDMNEPAVFYTLEGLEKVRRDYQLAFADDNLSEANMNYIFNSPSTLMHNSHIDKFFHLVDGNKINHKKVHNLYGTRMAQASAKGIQKANPDERYFLLSRSSYAGLHRVAAIWTGDNHSWWEHLVLNLKMLVSLNLCGFFFSGADIGGFSDDCSPELLIRWTQLGVFSPLFRNHCAKWAKHHEPWVFDQDTLAMTRDAIRLRYSLMPYCYSEYLDAIKDLRPFISSLSFATDADSDEYDIVSEIEDQFMFGANMMIAPICSPNTTHRQVYLPTNMWLEWRASNFENRKFSVKKNGLHLVKAELGEIPVFIKENSLVTLTDPQNNLDSFKYKNLYVIGLVTNSAAYKLTSDDGLSTDGQVAFLDLQVEFKNESMECRAIPSNNLKLIMGIESVNFEIYDANGRLHKFSIYL